MKIKPMKGEESFDVGMIKLEREWVQRAMEIRGELREESGGVEGADVVVEVEEKGGWREIGKGASGVEGKVGMKTVVEGEWGEERKVRMRMRKRDFIEREVGFMVELNREEIGAKEFGRIEMVRLPAVVRVKGRVREYLVGKVVPGMDIEVIVRYEDKEIGNMKGNIDKNGDFDLELKGLMKIGLEY